MPSATPIPTPRSVLERVKKPRRGIKEGAITTGDDAGALADQLILGCRSIATKHWPPSGK